MKSRLLFTTLFGFILLLGVSDRASAQAGISTDARLGITFPVGDLSTDAEGGIVLGANVAVDLLPRLSAYAGVNRHTFRCSGDCGQLGADPRSTGVGAGLRFDFPSPQEAVWWGRAGIVGHRFSSDLVTGDREVGLELGAGVDMPVRGGVKVSPMVGLINHAAGPSLSARYLTFGVGLSYRFR